MNHPETPEPDVDPRTNPDGEPVVDETPPRDPEEVFAETAAVILAAGEGSRFRGSTHKLMTKLRKRPLVAWSIDHARSVGFAEVIVVTGAIDLNEVVPDDVTLLLNHDWESGQARSLQVAVQYATMREFRAIVVGLGDQPMVPPSAWRDVALTDSPIAVAEFSGQQTPPVRLADTVWPLLPIEGDEGARGILRRRPEMVKAVPCEGHSIDVDTLADLERVQSRAAAEGLETWI